MKTKTYILVTAANRNTGFPAARTLPEPGYKVRAFLTKPESVKDGDLKALSDQHHV